MVGDFLQLKCKIYTFTIHHRNLQNIKISIYSCKKSINMKFPGKQLKTLRMTTMWLSAGYFPLSDSKNYIDLQGECFAGCIELLNYKRFPALPFYYLATPVSEVVGTCKHFT
jgi:hypothetical protein